MTHRILSLLLWIVLLTAISMAALAQTGTPSYSNAIKDGLDSLREAVGTSIDHAREDGVDALSPAHFERAWTAYEEARTSIERNREPELIRIKLKVAADELGIARKSAEDLRGKLGVVLDERWAAISAGSDSLATVSWKKAEERFRGMIRALEREPITVTDSSKADLAGVYRAVRREALRNLILNDARAHIAEVERKNGAKLFPAVVLRAQQALSRAEADVAQENLDAARTEARAAVHHADHVLALMTYSETSQKSKHLWEDALLPYDDALDKIETHLNAEYDYSRGPTQAASEIVALISSRQDSLMALDSTQQQTIKSLEGSLSDAQTHLADSQARIAELERRLASAVGQEGAAQQALKKEATIAERIMRAQDLFKPGEAVVLQDTSGSVIIRLQGLNFAVGATKLERSHLKILDKAIEAIQVFPGCNITVQGHTDSLGTPESNQTLSEERAHAAADYLTKKLNLSATQISAVGMGATMPLTSNGTPEGRARNRRMDIILSFPK